MHSYFQDNKEHLKGGVEFMGAAGNKKPKGMHKKHAPAYVEEEAAHENDLKKGKKK